MRKPRFHLIASLAVALSVSACGSTVLRPTSELALAATALKSAELAGAQELAPEEYRAARQKQAAAESAMAEENYIKARYLTREARVDAELARAAAVAAESRQALSRAQNRIRPLRSSLQPASHSR